MHTLSTCELGVVVSKLNDVSGTCDAYTLHLRVHSLFEAGPNGHITPHVKVVKAFACARVATEDIADLYISKET
jgi:hypothetical protein